MILCLNTGRVAKLIELVRSELQTLTTLSAKNWLRTPLLQHGLKSLYACPQVPRVAQNSKKSEKLISRGQRLSCNKMINLGGSVVVDVAVVEHKSWAFRVDND